MKIRTQNARRYLGYSEIYADNYGDNGQAAVYVMSRFHPEPVLVGIYADMGRAKGVLYEIDLAFRAKEPVFYAPAE